MQEVKIICCFFMEMVKICTNQIYDKYRGRISWIHECFQRELQMNIIGVEYPGYGKYKKFKTNAH